jgi:hypothetical protein
MGGRGAGGWQEANLERICSRDFLSLNSAGGCRAVAERPVAHVRLATSAFGRCALMTRLDGDVTGNED